MTGKPLVRVGSAYDDLCSFPEEARRKAGYQLRRVQQGQMPHDWKSMNSVGHGVYEIRIRTGMEHRVFYVAKHEEAVYVLHAFEKRTRQTRLSDIDLGKRRLAEVSRSREWI